MTRKCTPIPLTYSIGMHMKGIGLNVSGVHGHHDCFGFITAGTRRKEDFLVTTNNIISVDKRSTYATKMPLSTKTVQNSDMRPLEPTDKR